MKCKPVEFITAALASIVVAAWTPKFRLCHFARFIWALKGEKLRAGSERKKVRLSDCVTIRNTSRFWLLYCNVSTRWIAFRSLNESNAEPRGSRNTLLAICLSVINYDVNHHPSIKRRTIKFYSQQLTHNYDFCIVILNYQLFKKSHDTQTAVGCLNSINTIALFTRNCYFSIS